MYITIYTLYVCACVRVQNVYVMCVCPHLCLRFRVVKDATRAPRFATKGLLVSLLTYSFLTQKKRQGTVYPTEVTVQRRGFCGGTDIRKGRLLTYLQFYWNNSSLVPFLTRTRNPAFAPFCSKRLMHYNNLLNIFNFPDFLALRFALFHPVKGNFVLILALASNHPSVFRHRVPLRAVV